MVLSLSVSVHVTHMLELFEPVSCRRQNKKFNSRTFRAVKNYTTHNSLVYGGLCLGLCVRDLTSVLCWLFVMLPAPILQTLSLYRYLEFGSFPDQCLVAEWCWASHLPSVAFFWTLPISFCVTTGGLVAECSMTVALYGCETVCHNRCSLWFLWQSSRCGLWQDTLICGPSQAIQIGPQVPGTPTHVCTWISFVRDGLMWPWTSAVTLVFALFCNVHFRNDMCLVHHHDEFDGTHTHLVINTDVQIVRLSLLKYVCV